MIVFLMATTKMVLTERLLDICFSELGFVFFILFVEITTNRYQMFL